MKKAKTILSLILSLILAVSSLTAPAFASSDITAETAADPVYIPETADTSVSPDPADVQVYPDAGTGSVKGASAGMSGSTDIVVPENTDVYVPEVIEPPVPENTAEAVPEIISADDGKEEPRQEFETDHAKIRLFVPVTDINANIIYKLEKTRPIEGQDQLRDFKVEGQRLLESYYFDPSPENIKENHIELILKDIEKAFIYITDRNGVIIKYFGEIYRSENGSFEIIEDYSGIKKKAEFDFDRIIDEYGIEHLPGGFVIAETDPNYIPKDAAGTSTGSTTENTAVTGTESTPKDAAGSDIYFYNTGDTSESVNDSTAQESVEFREIVQGFAGGVPVEPEGSDVTVTLAGNMPESAGAAAVENENSGSLYDFDLTLTAGDAADLSQESSPVEVSVSGEQILNAVTDGKTIAVYHGEESVEVKSVSQDTVAFDAEQSGEYIIAAEDKLTESLIDAGQNVTISGMLPENLSAEAAVTDAAVDGAIFAAGITLSNYDVSGIEPKEGWEEVTVSVTDESIREAAAEGKELYVYQQTGEDSWEEISDFTLTDIRYLSQGRRTAHTRSLRPSL